MSPTLPARLAFDLVAAGLLLFGLSYWWLGNTAHEVAGTAFFLLLVIHNVFNRRFWGRINRTRRDASALFNVAVTIVLLVAMMTLLATSVLISNFLSGVMPFDGGFTARQIHTAAAYWAIVIVGVHLGLRWPIIMAMARNGLGFTGGSTVRTAVLRLITLALAVHGIWSWIVLGFGPRLAMQVSLDWWNVEESVAGFFVHCIAVAALAIASTYYAMKLFRRSRARTS